MCFLLVGVARLLRHLGVKWGKAPNSQQEEQPGVSSELVGL